MEPTPTNEATPDIDLRTFRCLGPIAHELEALDAESAAHIFQLLHGVAPVQVVGEGYGPVWLAGICEHGGVHLRSSTRHIKLAKPGKVECDAETCRYADPETHHRNRLLAALALVRRLAELCGAAPEGLGLEGASELLSAEHEIARAFVKLCAASLSIQPPLPVAEGEVCSGCEAPAIGRRKRDAVPLCWSCCQAEDVGAYDFDPAAVAELLAYLAEVLCALSSLDQPPFVTEARHRLGLGDPAEWSDDHFRAVLRYFDGTKDGTNGGGNGGEQ